MDERIQLLEELAKTGIASEMDISPFMLAHFRKPSEGPWGWQEVPPIAKSFLLEMVDNKYINCKAEEIDMVIQSPHTIVNENVEHWFDKPLYARITSLGLDHLNQHILSKSIIETNSISIKIAEKNYMSQEKSARRVYTVSLLTAFISALTLAGTIYQIRVSKLPEKELQHLYRQLDTVKSGQSLTASRLDSLRKHSPSSLSIGQSTYSEKLKSP
jgi:hypothetical protein